MGVRPRIYLICSVFINLICINLIHPGFFLQQSNLRLKIIRRITAVHLHVKRILSGQNLRLKMIEHQRHRTSQKRQRKQCSQSPHSKTHGADFRGKLTQKEQHIFPVYRVSLSFHIAGYPGCDPRIKQINGQYQTDEKE